MVMAEESLKFRFFMSQLKHIRDVKDTEKTHISVVFHKGNGTYCILRRCKGRDLSGVCRGLCQIRHPNTAVVYDYVYENGDTYILEENLTGTSLEEVLSEDRRFSEKETAQLMLRLCDGLEPLHRLEPPLVHNDINPSNIMLREDGSVKLFDFDISRRYKQGAGQNTVLFGTEEYASPEHYGYGQSEPRTDIYCMGVTMHKMLTGESLTAEHHITYRGKLRPIVEKCLRLDPKNRYRDVRALRKDLEGFLARKKRLLRVLAFAVTGIVLLGLLLWGWYKHPQEMSNSQSQQTQALPPAESTAPATEAPVLPSDEAAVPPVTVQDNTTPENAVPVAISESCTVILQTEAASYYVFTAEETGLHTLTLENRTVDSRVFYSGDRGQGSLFSGWADHEATTSRSFRIQQGDTVYVKITANDNTKTGECVLRVDVE